MHRWECEIWCVVLILAVNCLLTSAVLSQSLIHDIGMSEKDYHIWEELQMSAFSILMHCRQYVF